MKEGDIVAFNKMVPAHLVKKLNLDSYRIGFIDKNGLIFLEEDPGNPKEIIYQNWLRVICEA